MDMIPFQLLFYPPTIFRRYPVRQWREVTLWLKWGILIALSSILVSVAMLESPEDSSYIFQLLNYLGEQNDAITLSFPVKFGLFFLVEVFLIMLVWLVRSTFIFVAYQIIDTATFTEGYFALSIAGASLVNGIWVLVPGLAGTVLGTLHGIVLITYLVSQINRVSPATALAIAILPGVFPFII